jgi:hypothetical protein
VHTPLELHDVNGGLPPVGQSAKTPQQVGTGVVAALEGNVGQILLRCSLIQFCSEKNEYAAKIATMTRITITKIKDHVGTPLFLASIKA